MYKVTIDDHFDFDIEDTAGAITVNGHSVELDSSIINARETNILYQTKSYNVEVVEVDQQSKVCRIKVNGNIYSARVEDQFDQLLKQLGMDKFASGKVAEIKAPMPGLVLKVLLASGDEVKKGDNLLILEAMKMENMIKSTTDGVIKNIAVKQGDKVEKNQILIQFA
ncbi:acetyl-CoA carboxylase biotin carboxyl carrier protein subunit [Pedobacter sandarakinus]|uniref:acetyl-CoA carboxylase biotin carboxyl carrier protein subunit n=1 Tax=Pedobacter sandarakinus TaxID=353156 RepID=UPI002245C8E8|nr:acetyl-CoA carboxylase biotin carboxyl carrier protein subunit [Pedobacter sandarakinus]MCX2573936.1 biotin/lipoyl-binding protein [Pedobacter sandarakinus]